jgi:transcriptional antiterminator RfaH
MTDDLHWYCLRTKPKTERITSTILRSEADLEVFCPFIRFERARRSGRLWVTEAMFPGYVFARFRYLPQFRQVQASRGVMKIVNFGGRPAVVSDQIIDDLRGSVKDEETVTIDPAIQVGEEVNVVEGPFRGIKAVVSRVMPGRERVALLLEVVGMEREVEVGLKTVLPDVPHPMARGGESA